MGSNGGSKGRYRRFQYLKNDNENTVSFASNLGFVMKTEIQED